MNKQKPWIAVLLSLVFNPLGMLYLARPLLALGYLIMIVVAVFIALQQSNDLVKTTLPFVPSILAAIHGLLIIRNTSSQQRPWYSRWYGLISVTVMFFATVFFIRTFVGQIYSVPSASMVPTVNPGDYIVVNRFGYGQYSSQYLGFLHKDVAQTVTHGDLIVFEWPTNRETTFVMRVVGLPGDRIEYQNRQLFVNGTNATLAAVDQNDSQELVTEKIGDMQYIVANTLGTLPKSFSTVVADDHLFVMGDNRDNANDSRYWGQLPVDHVVGKVISIF